MRSLITPSIQQGLQDETFLLYYSYYVSKTRLPATASLNSTIKLQSALLLTLSQATFSRLIHVNEEHSVKKNILTAGPLKIFAQHYGAFAAQRLYIPQPSQYDTLAYSSAYSATISI